MKSLHSRSGFTLLEVILSITILSTLAVLSTQTISRALKARAKIQAEVDDVGALRDSARMIRADLNLAFHHRDFEQETLDLATKPKAPTTTSGPLPPPPPQPVKREAQRIDPTTDFVGSDTEMDFVTLNSGRLTTANVQADFVEVGYSLKPCNNLSTGTSSKCLFRRTQNVIDDDVKTGGNEIVMLENVTEFKLRFIGDTKQDWVSAWNSTSKSSDGGTKGRFPDAVEVSLSVEREIEKKTRSYSLQLVIPIHFPNNSADKTSKSLSSSPVPGGTIDQ